MIAKDGKSFNIDNINRKLEDNEVEIIQYLRPDAQRRRMVTTLTKELVSKANNMILSAEQTDHMHLAIYGRFVGQDEEDEITMIADNFESPNDPNAVLENMILKLDAKRK